MPFLFSSLHDFLLRSSCSSANASILFLVNLDTLEPQQLAQVKKQLEEELEHLTNSFSQLHGAQNKFRECLRCVQSRAADSQGTSRLPPLGHPTNRAERSRREEVTEMK